MLEWIANQLKKGTNLMGKPIDYDMALQIIKSYSKGTEYEENVKQLNKILKIIGCGNLIKK